MKIEIKHTPRYKNASPEDCIHRLIVNGYAIGEYVGGKNKKYENPEKWAKEMLIKRRLSLMRNITRTGFELIKLKKELEALSE